MVPARSGGYKHSNGPLRRLQAHKRPQARIKKPKYAHVTPTKRQTRLYHRYSLAAHTPSTPPGGCWNVAVTKLRMTVTKHQLRQRHEEGWAPLAEGRCLQHLLPTSDRRMGTYAGHPAVGGALFLLAAWEGASPESRAMAANAAGDAAHTRELARDCKSSTSAPQHGAPTDRDRKFMPRQRVYGGIVHASEEAARWRDAPVAHRREDSCNNVGGTCLIIQVLDRNGTTRPGEVG